MRRLLLALFGDRPIVIAAIKPEARTPLLRAARASSTASRPVPAVVASALRGYFRYRATCGDQVHGLIGVLSYPANWQLASLPKALSGAEVERLLGSLGHDGPSARRADAIVRCALDLGLRSGEVARLRLDDIDWRAGTITLRSTKGRREDMLPLPAATGEAIAAYLKHERPKTTNRAVFVRHVAPRDQPIGPDLVRKTIRQAYARAGLPYTRVAPAAPHDGQPAAGGRQFAQGGGRCAAPSLAEHHADLRQARQPQPGGGGAAVAGERSMSAPITANARRALPGRASPPGLPTAQHRLSRCAASRAMSTVLATTDR